MFFLGEVFLFIEIRGTMEELMSSLTPDEKLLLKLYQLAEKEAYKHVPYPLLLQATGQKETATKNIVKHLAQANFIEKGEETLALTPHGIAFVEEHLL